MLLFFLPNISQSDILDMNMHCPNCSNRQQLCGLCKMRCWLQRSSCVKSRASKMELMIAALTSEPWCDQGSVFSDPRAHFLLTFSSFGFRRKYFRYSSLYSISMFLDKNDNDSWCHCHEMNFYAETLSRIIINLTTVSRNCIKMVLWMRFVYAKGMISGQKIRWCKSRRCRMVAEALNSRWLPLNRKR